MLAGAELPTNVIEVVDLVWKGLRHCYDALFRGVVAVIEVVDLVWKGLRHVKCLDVRGSRAPIEVVDLVWKGLRQAVFGVIHFVENY